MCIRDSRTSVSGGRKSIETASLVPLPSSPIAIPTPPPPALKLDLGPPAALSPFAEMGEVARRWEAQVLNGKAPAVSTRLFGRESPGRLLPKTPSSLDLMGMVPLALRTSEGGKTPGQGRLLMTPTPLEPDDPFADMPTPMPGTSQTLDLDDEEPSGMSAVTSNQPGPPPPTPTSSTDVIDRAATLEPDDPFSNLRASQVSFGNTGSSISSLKLSVYEVGSICSTSPGPAAYGFGSDSSFHASALDLTQTSADKLADEQDSDPSSPATSDWKTPTDDTAFWAKTPSYGLMSPTRKVKLPIRSAPVKQPVIHEPEVGLARQSSGIASSLTVQQRFFPSTLADATSATPQASERRERSLDTTSSTVSSSSFHDSVRSPMSSSVYSELPPLSRCKSIPHSPTPGRAKAADENSSPLRTPSMGDKVAFELQRSERNARYNAICSGQFNKIVHYDLEIQLPNYDIAGSSSQRTTPRSTDNEGSEADGGVRLAVEAESDKATENPIDPIRSRLMITNAGFTPKRLRFVPSASVDSAAPTTSTTAGERDSDQVSVGSGASVDS